jgi:hypothetical protein
MEQIADRSSRDDLQKDADGSVDIVMDSAVPRRV